MQPSAAAYKLQDGFLHLRLLQGHMLDEMCYADQMSNCHIIELTSFSSENFAHLPGVSREALHPSESTQLHQGVIHDQTASMTLAV